MLRLLAVLVLVVLLGVLGALVLWQVLQDAGYVLVVWQGWQMQTSVVVLAMLVLSFAVASVLGLLALSTLSSLPARVRQLWHARRHRQALQHAEHLAGYWLLDQPRLGSDDLAALRQLRPDQPVWTLLHAQLQGLHPSEKTALPEELVLLLRCDEALAAANRSEVAGLLQVLLHQPPGPLAAALQPAYHAALTVRWVQYARLAPWAALSLSPPDPLNEAQWRDWLQVLGQQGWEDPAQGQALLAQLDQQPVAQQHRLAAGWLQVLVHWPEGQARGWPLALSALQHRLDLEVLRGWVALWPVWAQPQGVLPEAASLLDSLIERYPGQPLLHLAQVHLALLQGEPAQARQLAQAWPTPWLLDRLYWLEQAMARPVSAGGLLRFIYDENTGAGP